VANNQIVSLNMTGFFKRELQMYALGDIKFKKPISIKQVAYVLGFYIVWAIPIILIFGIQLNPFFAVLVIAPPLVLGTFAVRPIFGGKTLIDFAKTAFIFLGEPKAWADLKPYKPKEVYEVNSEIWISRRRELQLLADMIERQDK
jgi:hypothetical protein